MIFLRYPGGNNEVFEVVGIIEGHRLMETQFAPGASASDDEPEQ